MKWPILFLTAIDFNAEIGAGLTEIYTSPFYSVSSTFLHVFYYFIDLSLGGYPNDVWFCCARLFVILFVMTI